MIRELKPKPDVDILVVDDTPANLKLLMKLLVEKGYGVRPVMEGTLALAAAQLDPPDLILLDIKMPGMDGYEICRRLKADERTCDVPVIFLTVLDDIIDVVKGFRLGAVDYITKPVKTGELVARIENQVKIRSLQHQLSKQNQQLQSLLEQYQRTEIALRESEEKFSKAFQRSPIPLSLSTIQDGCYLDINQEFIRQTGYTREEIVNHTILELNFWVDLDDRVQMLDHIQAKGYVRNFETRLRTKSGKVRDVILSVEVIRLNDCPYFLVAAEDVTERKAAERKLANRTQELTQTLATLKDTQAQLIQSAKMAALGNLVAGVAHEINTPVGTAIMMASTLENATKAIASHVTQGSLTQLVFHNYLDTASEASHLILDNLNRAGELVQSFKQVAVDQTSLKDRTFAIKPYLEEILINLSSQLKHTPHQVRITGDQTLEVHSYPGALSQVVTNLVMNSLSHAFPAERAGQIFLDVYEQQDQCVLEYRDDGIGIPAENLDKIFEPFFTTAHNKGGSGLGLHLVYNLVTQKLQGRIDVSSGINCGATFRIMLPKTLTVG